MLTILLIILGLAVLLAGLYVLAIRGRRGNEALAGLRGWSYAHRGLHDKTRPENSMAAFRAALDKGYGIELDVHLLADGQLAVIHDSPLVRTTGAEGRIEDLTVDQLEQYHLEGTEETIPTFGQVLELFDGKAPMIIELKAVGGNHAALCQAACQALEQYRGVYCLESFDPRCLRWLRKHQPQLVRGQLSRNFLATKDPLPWLLKLVMTHQLTNFLTRPDFVAYRFADRKALSNRLIRGLWKVQGVAWTLREPHQHQQALQEDWIPIFEHYEP